MWQRVLVATVALLAAVAIAGPTAAQRKVRVVTSITDLKALTEVVGGDLVDVESLVRGAQNAHDVELRPSLMVKLRHADMVVRNGLGLDFWLDQLLAGAHNSRIIRGAPGYVDASRGVDVIPTRGPMDRSRGDVHPEGDPHYTLDPVNARIVTATIVEGLTRVAPHHGARFERRRTEFLGRLDAALTRWQKTLEPFRGAKVVTYHETFNYFLRRFGLVLAGTIEDRPGIPPSPGHLSTLVRTIREQKIAVILAEPYADRRTVELVARDSGARALTAPSSVGAVQGADTYLDVIEHNVRALATALGDRRE